MSFGFICVTLRETDASDNGLPHQQLDIAVDCAIVDDGGRPYGRAGVVGRQWWSEYYWNVGTRRFGRWCWRLHSAHVFEWHDHARHDDDCLSGQRRQQRHQLQRRQLDHLGRHDGHQYLRGQGRPCRCQRFGKQYYRWRVRHQRHALDHLHRHDDECGWCWWGHGVGRDRVGWWRWWSRRTERRWRCRWNVG